MSDCHSGLLILESRDCIFFCSLLVPAIFPLARSLHLPSQTPDLVYISSIDSFPINNSGGGLVKTLRQYVLQTQALLSIPWFSVSAYYEGHWRRRDREFESHSPRIFFAVFAKSLTAFRQICNIVNEPRYVHFLRYANAALQ